MSQISPPVRILLVGCVLFLAAWMTVLKPKGATTPAQPTAATPRVAAGGEQAGTALGKAVESANNASKAQSAANARHGDESQSTPAVTPSTAAAKKGANTPAAGNGEVTEAGLPLPVAKAVAEHKILVLLFWNPKAADDRMVRRELRSVGSRHRKEVVVHIADVKNISRYAPVTRGANVEQSPSVVVVGRDRQATVLEGFTDRETIRQAVYDALRTK